MSAAGKILEKFCQKATRDTFFPICVYHQGRDGRTQLIAGTVEVIDSNIYTWMGSLLHIPPLVGNPGLPIEKNLWSMLGQFTVVNHKLQNI